MSILTIYNTLIVPEKKQMFFWVFWGGKTSDLWNYLSRLSSTSKKVIRL